MNILDKWIFDSINFTNMEEPVDKTGYVCCLFFPLQGNPYNKWLKPDKYGCLLYPERKELYFLVPHFPAAYGENEPVPVDYKIT